MGPNPKKRLWLAAVVLSAVALAIAGPSLLAGMNNTASAAGGCCTMMGSAGNSSAQMACSGCTALSGVVTGVDKRSGSATIQLTPGQGAGDAAKKLINQAKVGDSLPLMIMLDKNGKPVACPMGGAAAAAGKYSCPMHPKVVSDKPGKCPKCGMDLEKAGG